MSETEMKVDPARGSALLSQLQGVADRIAAVAKGRPVGFYFVFHLPRRCESREREQKNRSNVVHYPRSGWWPCPS